MKLDVIKNIAFLVKVAARSRTDAEKEEDEWHGVVKIAFNILFK